MASSKAAANLPGETFGPPSGFNDRYTASALLGLAAGSGSKAAGHSLPPVTAMAGDRQMVWWSPDSPTFWVLGLISLTVLGMAGADVRVRLFKGKAGASVGTT
jgi:hypothetical protein